ncbi:uncharacterized protein LOC109726654 isoform X2 [Ananas comosus]|uniref:Uncharacterized protein LOC109726654 isoform X2 n=1 Tax=Ananas comosus TaxID=4615 RepID=A0A6P5H1N4_ANACO|nr:uncharacterized protein LOC109726654 isoform X2 [Ananas comosus]
MAETLTLTLTPAEGFDADPIDLGAIRSRFEELSQRRIHGVGSCDSSSSELGKSLEACAFEFQAKIKQIESENSDIAALGSGDLDAYVERMKKEISSVEEENSKISAEISGLTDMADRDLAQLDGDLEALACSLKFIDSGALGSLQSGLPDGRLVPGDLCESQVDYKFEALELDQQIEKSKSNVNVLQSLDYALKRVEAIGQVEYMLSEVKIIEFEHNCIRLFVKMSIPTSDGLVLGRKLDCAIEPCISDHELLIEVMDQTMELKSVEIFPDDVYIEGLIDMVKSSRDFISSITSSLGWFVRQVQHRILLCNLRRLLVKDANKSRHSFEYSDRDETVTAHLVGGIDAFIKISLDWPLSSSGLKLISIKSSDKQSKSISLSFLCKVKELSNSLDLQTRLHLVRFVDAIEEILVREMQSELHSK